MLNQMWTLSAPLNPSRHGAHQHLLIGDFVGYCGNLPSRPAPPGHHRTNGSGGSGGTDGGTSVARAWVSGSMQSSLRRASGFMTPRVSPILANGSATHSAAPSSIPFALAIANGSGLTLGCA